MRILSVLVLLLCCGPGESRAQTKRPSKQQIEDWIEQLGAPSYKVRERASRSLWMSGKAAQADLAAALQKADPESRWRIESLLELFRSGIYPDVPLSILGPLRRYRGASYSERKRIVMELFKVGPKAYRSLLILALGEKDLGRRSSIFWQARTLAEKQVPGLVAEGKHEQANALLELAMSSGFSLSVQHFAAYCLMTDRVDAAIAKYEERHRVSQGKNVAIGLAYLYRAKGDLKRAQAVALKSGDATLIENILHERGDWKALAARVHRRVLGRAGLGGGGTQAQTKDSSKRRHSGGIVELGWLSAYHRLAGNPTQYQQVLSRIRSYPNREPSNGAAWYAAEALLINGEVKQAIALLLEHKRYTRVLRLLMAQHRFKEALELADRIGRSWKGEQRFNFDLSVAELLVRVGRRQAALELLRSAFEAEWKLDDLKRLDGVIRVLRELGMAQEAYALSVRILTQKPKFDPLAVLRALFEERKLAIEWWQLLEGEQRAPVERLARVRQILELRGAGLDTEIKWALGVARRQALEQLAAQAVRRKRYTIAESCLDRLVRLWPSANSHGRLGDFLVSLERWREASAAYLEAWEKDRTKPATLFNHGWALIQAGDTVDGRKLVRQARLLPLGSDHSRYQLAKVMRKRGWTTQARAEHTLILRTGGFRSWYVHNSIWYGAYRAKELGRFDQASVGYERYALQCFKSETAYGTLRSYLAVLAKVLHWRCHGLLKAGKVMQAVVEARKAQAVYPGDLEVPIMVSAALERMGRSKQAAAIFDTSYGSLREKLASYPSSPYLHNSLAWLSARCGRRLDEALAHARRAVKLEPNNASYLDTLAEVHHRKGNKLEAVRLMKRCVELRPDSTSYRVRLAEFQK